MVDTDRPYNEIADDLVIKYTINIPIQDFAKIAKITKRGTPYNGRKSPWIRQAIVEKLAKVKFKERPVTETELRRIMAEGKVTETRKLKRYPGFIGGLSRNSFRLVWLRRKYLTRDRTGV